MNFIDEIKNKAKRLNNKIAFPDAEDTRTINTAIILKSQGIGQPILVGDTVKIRELAEANSLSIDGIEIINPIESELLNEFANKLYLKRQAKGMTPEQARDLMIKPIYFAGQMLDAGLVKVVVGGNVSSTGDIIKAAIYTVGVAPGISIVSSFFIMVKDDRTICFADCAVNPDPNDQQLADIAITSARNFKSITGIDSKIAMLSFSTKGSASHPHVDKVIAATEIVKEKAPDLLVDGELQADAALVASIGEKKCKGSPVAGNANVLVFPDLDSGNIGYKLTQRLGGFEAVGPVVQGLAKPYCDLSRGCSVDDMVNVAAICSLMA